MSLLSQKKVHHQEIPKKHRAHFSIQRRTMVILQDHQFSDP